MVENNHTFEDEGKVSSTSSSSSSWQDAATASLLQPPLVAAQRQSDNVLSGIDDDENQPLLLVEGATVVDDYHDDYTSHTGLSIEHGTASASSMTQEPGLGSDRDLRTAGPPEEEVEEDSAAAAAASGDLVLQPRRPHDLVQAAGVATGVLGLLCGGPIFGLLLGLGAAYYASQPPGTVASDTARAVGELALQAQSQARHINEQHHVLERTEVWARRRWEEAVQYDQEHHLVNRTQSWAIRQAQGAADFAQRHRVVEKCIRQVGSWIFWVLDKHGHRHHPSPPPPLPRHHHAHDFDTRWDENSYRYEYATNPLHLPPIPPPPHHHVPPIPPPAPRAW